MRCRDVRDHINELWMGEAPLALREHLATCPVCDAWAREARRVGLGFLALAEEPAPDPTLGFAARLVRRLKETADQSAREVFMERAGRRFVYATLLMTLGLLLALVLPSSGPVRGPATADLLMAQPELVAARPNPVVGGDLQEDLDVLLDEVSNGQNKGLK